MSSVFHREFVLGDTIYAELGTLKNFEGHGFWNSLKLISQCNHRLPLLYLFKFTLTFTLLVGYLAQLQHKVLMVSYCGQSVSAVIFLGVRPASCTHNFARGCKKLASVSPVDS